MAMYKDDFGGVYDFTDAQVSAGMPGTYTPSVTAMTADEVAAWEAAQATPLADVQTAQSAAIDIAYIAAVQVDVAFTTSAGVSKTFQADCEGTTGTDSQSVLLKAVTGYGISGAVPDGFTWKSSDNTMVPFTLADLRGLYVAMLSQGNTAFAKRATLKAQIAAATIAAAVEAITWDSASS